ncbi:MAG: glycine oxidase ThiO [Actinomycetota bacterium]|jgi:glycine oxidase|nr:glycine oxidase ThiO [Actinomycetota bacterium]
MTKLQIGVVGGGVAGLSAAFRLAKHGHDITVFDPNPAMGASHAAAGMLAPASEANFSEVPLLRLMQHSNELWPEFAAELEEISRVPVGLRMEGTLVIGYEPNDARDLERLAEFQNELGIEVTRLTRHQLKELEPELGGPFPFAAMIDSDNQLDNRALMKSLLKAIELLGVRLVRQAVKSVHSLGPNIYELYLDDDKIARPEIILLAAGSYLGDIGGLPAPISSSIRPVKGQIIRVQAPSPTLLRHVVRSKTYGKTLYMVPRVSGEIVIGATQEEVGFDMTAKVRPIAEMLTSATLLLPGIGEADFTEQMVRFRPGSFDNAPILGRYEDSNLFLCLGHFRHGILLSAALSKYVSASIETGRQPPEIEQFSASRLEVN